MNKAVVFGRALFLSAVLSGTLAQAADPPGSSDDSPTLPPLSQVDDILSGRRTLFQVDDLILGYTDKNHVFSQGELDTLNGSVSHVVPMHHCGVGDVHDGADYAIGIGHMFDFPQDVRLLVSHGYAWTFHKDASECGKRDQFSSPLTAVPAFGLMARGDFDGDGYADFAVIVDGAAYAITATDVSNPDGGVTFGPPADGGALGELATLALTTGDFDGDGKDELAVLAVLTQDPSILRIAIYDAEKAASGLKFVPIGSTELSEPNNVISRVDATAGPFTGVVSPDTGRQEVGLLIAHGVTNGKPVNKGGLVLTTMTVTPASPPHDPSSVTLAIGQQQRDPQGIGPNVTGLESGHLDFFSPTVQAVMSTYDVDGDHDGGNGNHVSVITVDVQSGIDIADTISYGSEHMDSTIPVTQAGIALGNFGQPSDPNHPLTLQIASLDIFNYTCDSGEHCDGDDPHLSPRLRFFQVDPANNFKLSGHTNNSSTAILELDRLLGQQHPTDNDKRYPWLVLAAGDVQGRSLLLGSPTKISTNHVQPSLVVGMPPSHIDWIAPAFSDGTPEEFNLSAISGGYFASFNSGSASSTTSSTRSKTSWTHAVETQVSGGYQWGGTAIGSISASVTASTGYMHEKSVATYSSSYQAVSSDVTVHTGNDDNVWTVSESQNIYVYPVIGQTACPEQKPNCSESERLPLRVMFYGPSSTRRSSVDGSKLEWYQPVWQPNNVFSYPWTPEQAKALAADFSSAEPELLTDTKSFDTDSAQTIANTTWTGQSGNGTTTGSNTNISWGASFSASLTPPKLTGGPSASISVSYNGSKAVSSLNTETTSTTSSLGIGVTKPGTFANPDLYSYAFSTYVFGRKPLPSASDTYIPDGDVQTGGPLLALYTADPTDETAGSWWKGAYGKPDIALNHPARWTVLTATGTAGRSNCRPVTNTAPTYSCASFNPLDASDANLWNSEGLWMKGLLITPADGALDGPQLMQAKAGESVRISARVYNLSLADMPPDSNVVVQFYVQPMSTMNEPAGNAVLIQNVTLAAIPGFNSQAHPGTPNWAVATTVPFDTTAYADQHLIFWVLVVGKDSSGMVAEMPSHGLTGIPPTVESISDAANWIEPHSNNLGYYHSLFYVAPAEPPKTLKSSTPAIPQVTAFSVSPERPALNEKAVVRAILHAGDADLDGLSVDLFDGDPTADGNMFEQEIIAHVSAGSDHEVSVPYRARTCGEHTLYLDVDARVEPATITLTVPGDPLPTVQELLDSTFALQMRAGDRQHLVNRLLDIQQSLSTAQSVEATLTAVGHYRQDVASMRGNMIPVAQADEMLDKSDLLSNCVLVAGP